MNNKPRKISNKHTKIANNNDKLTSHSIPNTSKYSCNLYEKPSGSISFKNPEKIRKAPYMKRKKLIIKFI